MVVTRIRGGERASVSGAHPSIEGAWEAASARRVAAALVAIVAVSTLLRAALVGIIRAPTVFSDELGYQKLAQSIGNTGHLALFNQHGLSYSPLYPSVLSPIYALGASGATAYTLIKLLNALLISLAVFPVYKIARFVLPRRSALLVAALSVAAPLMFYSSYVMSENLAYPICLAAVWALLVAIRTPSVRNDAYLLAAVAASCATRTQLVALVPAVLTAVPLAAVLDRDRGSAPLHRVAETLRGHRLLALVTALGAAAAVVGILAGRHPQSLLGRYAVVTRNSLPPFGHFIHVLVWNAAGLDFAVGFVPFAGALVAAAAFASRGFRGHAAPFVAVAVSLTLWLLLEVAFDAAVFDGHPDQPRIHERFLIYLVPFFLVALFATLQRPQRTRVYLAAAGVTALIPLAVSFHTVVNASIAVDTFGLAPFSYSHRGHVHPVPYVAAIAVCAGAILSLAYFAERRRTRGIFFLVLVTSFVVSFPVLARIAADSIAARKLLPAHTNWVDAARPSGPVVLIAGAGKLGPPRETAYFNLSISRYYYLCRPIADPEFGGAQVKIDGSGGLRDANGPLEARYVVAPARFGLRGRIIATNPKGHEVLIAPPGGRLELVRPGPAARCAGPTPN